VRERRGGKERERVRVRYRLRAALAVVPMLLVLAAAPPAWSAADVATGLYNRGNDRYAAGEYEEAIEEYLGAVACGVESGVLYYNLGNAYFKEGDLGRAILWYERARRLLPRDEDVRANLDYALAFLADDLPTPSPGIVLGWLFATSTFFNLRELVLLVSGMYAALVLALILLVLYRGLRFRRARLTAAVVLGCCLLFFGSIFAYRVYARSHSVHAIILAHETDARSGPGDDYQKLFTLHRGTSVEVREQRQGWILVKLPTGAGGWIAGDALEPI
jgi:tetratricopeptide (TPR) repeat protein